MTIKEILKKHHKIEIELLLAHLLKKPKEFVFLHPEHRLSSYQVIKLSSLVKRREKGEPMAYILGYRDFMGLRFKVNKDVLIPRPETEELVHKVYQVLKVHKAGKPIKILDVGTGSGNIIVSLASNLQKITNVTKCKWKFFASDVSARALAVARQNAKTILIKNFNTTKYGRIRFFRSNLLKNLHQDFDIIITNLPYLPFEVRLRRTKEGGWKEWKNNTSAESIGLKFEPQRALFAKEKGLHFYRKLLEQIAKRNYKPKLIYFEFDPRQKRELHRLIKKNQPKAEIKFHRDFRKFWRYAEIAPEG